MKAIKHDDTYSVFISDTENGVNFWMDVYNENGEIIADWNKYIFHLDNENDVKIKKYQECPFNFDMASSIAIEYIEKNNLINKL